VDKRIKIALLALLAVALIVVAVLFFRSVDVAVLNPQGEIADKQRNLIFFTLFLSAIVVIPVFILLAVFAWKYREGNHKARYRPNWDSNKLLESIWWGIPCVIILILGVVTWHTSHELDPYKALNSNVKPINVQVVALQWKWLFIYPDLHIASVNLLQFPEKTPIDFTLTADAPMNSFWVPSLGGQVYAMSGMSTQLHLSADTTGDYHGSSANISGKGFADMTFIARSTTKTDFDAWVQRIAHSAGTMSMTEYSKLAQPGTNKEPVFYSLADRNLYDEIIMKYMSPMPSNQNVKDTPTHNESSSEHSDMMDMPGMEGM
jgi:cytochrome o ubiquinol oxidase subunit 2